VNRDIVIYCTCTFLLGLVIGSLLIGPHLKKFGGAPQPAEAIASPAAEGGGAPQGAPPADMNTMNTVREQLAKLKEQVARDPRNFDALVQLGDMYMDAAKFPEAIQYLERALAVREDSNVRVDLGICYKQNGQLDKSLAAFQRSASEAPGQWQPLYNEALVLGEMKRFDEARSISARLKQMRPDDPEVQKLDQALSTAR
jgi:cytochrome c-type biogenesis protein CcmH/NrfG